MGARLPPPRRRMRWSRETPDGLPTPRRAARARLGGARARERLHRGAQLREAVDDQPRRLQGARRLEDRPPSGRPAPRPLVGGLRRSAAEHPRGARQHLEPEPRGVGGPVPAGPGARARGARRVFSDRDARARLHAVASIDHVRLRGDRGIVQRHVRGQRDVHRDVGFVRILGRRPAAGWSRTRPPPRPAQEIWRRPA